MENSQKTLISLLVVLAVIALGYLIYSNQESSVSQNNNAPSTNRLPTSPKLDINKLLAKNPGSGATASQLKSFSAEVSSYAVDTSSVEVTACSPNPAVVRVPLNKPISFKNTDSLPHKLVNGNITINVPANSSKSVTPAFAGPGIYAYSCDTKILGIFLVMP